MKKTPDIEVRDIGSTVKIGPTGEQIQAVITGISIRNGAHVTYECVWWDGRDRNLRWVEAFEVTDGDKRRAVVGLVQ